MRRFLMQNMRQNVRYVGFCKICDRMFAYNRYPYLANGGLVDRWLGRWIRDQEVTSLTPSRCPTKKQLWASYSHLSACVNAGGIAAGFNS